MQKQVEIVQGDPNGIEAWYAAMMEAEKRYPPRSILWGMFVIPRRREFRAFCAGARYHQLRTDKPSHITGDISTKSAPILSKSDPG